MHRALLFVPLLLSVSACAGPSRVEAPGAEFRRELEILDARIRSGQARPGDWLERGKARLKLAFFEDPGFDTPYEAAVEDFGAVLERDPDCLEAWRLRGSARTDWALQVAMDGGEPEELFAGAVDDLREAARRDPRRAESWARLGFALAQWGAYAASAELFDEARVEYLQAILLGPRDASVWRSRGESYLLLAQSAEARGLPAEEDYRIAFASLCQAAALDRDLAPSCREMIGEIRARCGLAAPPLR